MTTSRFLVALAIMAVTTPARAQQPDVVEDLRTRVANLERQLRELRGRLAVPEIDELDRRLRIHERQDELRRDGEAERQKAAAVLGVGREGFQVRSADGGFALRLRGLVHSDGRFYASDEADIAADAFLLRRVRPIVEATMFRNFDVRLMPDFGEGRTVLQDAYLDLRFTGPFKVRAGKFKAPFGLERLASAGELLFVERALPTGLAPNRDIGVMAYGDLLESRLSYAAGLVNGVVDGSSTDSDDRDSKDVVARIFTHPFRGSKSERLQGLGVGVAASYGTQRGTASAPGLATYRTTGQQVFFRYLSDGTVAGTAVADGTRRRLSAQGYYYAGRFGLLGEQVFSSQDVRRGATAGTAEQNAWQVAATWVLTGENATYRGVAPKAAFDRTQGTWGAFEVTARYHELRVGKGIFPVFASDAVAAGRAQAAAAGLNWYLNRTVKLVFDYEETRFAGGSAGGDRSPAREFLTRLQFSF